MPTTRVANADRNTVEFHVHGDGPLLVMIPSLGRRAGDFTDLAGRLAGAGYTAACIEPRGVGKSVGPMENLTLHDLAADAAAVIEEMLDVAERRSSSAMPFVNELPCARIARIW